MKESPNEQGAQVIHFRYHSIRLRVRFVGLSLLGSKKYTLDRRKEQLSAILAESRRSDLIMDNKQVDSVTLMCLRHIWTTPSLVLHIQDSYCGYFIDGTHSSAALLIRPFRLLAIDSRQLYFAIVH